MGTGGRVRHAAAQETRVAERSSATLRVPLPRCLSRSC
jgi:hypothetical protein